MITLTGSYFRKTCALALIILLVYGPVGHGRAGEKSTTGAADAIREALDAYQRGLYETAAAKLAGFMNSPAEQDPEITAKVYLLFGACCEKTGQDEKARDYFSRIKKAIEEGSIDRVPQLPGIEPESFPSYRQIFSDSSFFTHKQPLPVSEVIKHNVVHAPRKSMEKKEKEKRKKKFPWLLAAGAVIIAGTAAVLLMSAKKGENPSEFKEVDWVRIPAGEFLMGDTFNEGEADEQPAHTVYLDEYYISKYEVTYTQYDYFCESTGREKPADIFVWASYDRRGSFPVVSISWNDASAFCEWLSRKTGRNIHLPTEAQWEKAARGSYQYRYPWGNRAPDCTIANYSGCAGYEGYPGNLSHVGLYAEGISPYGIHDMAGNAWEWCRDRYSASYYSSSPKNNPQGAKSGTFRVLRGGGIDSPVYDIRAANRSFDDPASEKYAVGFRVVMEK